MSDGNPYLTSYSCLPAAQIKACLNMKLIILQAVKLGYHKESEAQARIEALERSFEIAVQRERTAREKAATKKTLVGMRL